MRTAVTAILVTPIVFSQIVLNPPKDPAAISVDVELVNVLCTVRDRRGAYINDMNREDFEVREDGKLQEITHFAREVDTPMTVALLLDVSGSVEAILGTEKATARRFFDAVLGGRDRALLVGFADRIAVWQDLTGDKPLLQEALERAGPDALPSSGEYRRRGGTLLYDAVRLVADQKLKRLPGRKALILITDGEDNGSIAKIADAVKAAQEADTVVYGIHYVDEERYSSGRNGMGVLESLSTPTGGRSFHVSAKMPMAAVFAAIGEEMRNQYGMGYRPTGPRDGTQHRVEVKSRKAGLKVQARSGYYR